MSGLQTPTTRLEAPGLLFAYGTLRPANAEAMASGGWSADAVRGRLYDLGPYPALVDLDDPSAGWVEGFIRPVEEAELRDRLDPYEGVGEGPYRRATTATRAGFSAWIYVYSWPLPRSARGPFPRWDGPRNALGPGVVREDLDDGLIDRPEARD